MTDAQPDIHDIRVRLAEVNGKLDLIGTQMKSGQEHIATQMKAGDKNTEQLVALVKDQLTYHAADLGLVKAELREDRDRVAQGLSTIRTDLEADTKQIDGRVRTLERWQSQIRGMAFILPPISAILTGVSIKLMGG